MADDAQGASPKNELGEDAETRAARRELKQSSISDPPAAANSADAKTPRPDTPADQVSDAHNDEPMRDQVSSPKKKRAHDQLDGSKDAEDNDANSVSSTDSARDRASRLEPEKKRHRDEESKRETMNPSAEQTADGTSPAKKAPQTSTSAFAASGFGKLAMGSSPFASLSGSQASMFGSSGSSPFTSVSPAPGSQPTAAAATAPKLTFGGASSASPFAGLSSGTNGFGSAFGGGGFGFGSTLSGGKPLASFASSKVNPLQSEKPARPFGAPESENEDDGDDGDDGDDDAEPNETEQAASEKESEEKKRMRLQKVEVDDGEAGEATLLSVRAKMFHHDKEVGWKERGGGMLKINAPQACVEFDDSGAPIPGSFDASGLEADDDDDKSNGHKVVRLIMRQDQTHRVILNTAIVPAMNFQEKASLKSVGILFTAFEGEEAKPVSVTMRMSAANAKNFLNEIGLIQRELQGN